MIAQTDVEQDVDLIIWSMGLCNILRYHDQFYWKKETARTRIALEWDAQTEDGSPIPRSESVADHSWHMADMVMLIAPRFPQLDIGRCLQLVTLHDKLEIITGDYDPVGNEGKGTDAHAFNKQKKELKDAAERDALAVYLAKVNDVARPLHEELMQDVMSLQSPESRFIKAIDRLQVFAYVIKRKNGIADDGMVSFMLKYLSGCYTYFPAIRPYYDCLVDRLVQSIAAKREIPVETLKLQFENLMQAA